MKILFLVFGLFFSLQTFAKPSTVRWPGSLEEREQALKAEIEKGKRDNIRQIGAYIRAHGGAAVEPTCSVGVVGETPSADSTAPWSALASPNILSVEQCKVQFRNGKLCILFPPYESGSSVYATCAVTRD